jgi:HK97 gp10 family phage protein|tara:strand:- start:1536 stop:2081 length:546 start_codon:yes stop_codon:yes gene_type:complete
MITVDFDKKMQRQIELSLMNLGADMRKNKRQISKEVLKPSAQIISKEMKSIAPKLKGAQSFNVYRTPKLSGKLKAPKGMGKIYVKIKPGQLKKSIAPYQTKAGRKSPYFLIGPKYKFGVWTKPEKGGWFMHFVQFGTDTVKAQPFVGTALRNKGSQAGKLMENNLKILTKKTAKKNKLELK